MELFTLDIASTFYHAPRPSHSYRSRITATRHRTSSVRVSDTYPPRPEYYWMVAQSVLIATYGWSETGTPDGLSISLDDYPRAFTNLVTGTGMTFEELDKAFSEMQAIYQGRFGTMIEDERMSKIVHAIMWNLQEAKLDRRLPEQLVILSAVRKMLSKAGIVASEKPSSLCLCTVRDRTQSHVAERFACTFSSM